MSTNIMLPNIIYIGDVPIESSYHGSALLYRLLQKYPQEKICIVEAGFEASQPERKLPGVTYVYVQHPGGRLLRTRFNRWVASFFSLFARFRVRRVQQSIGNFMPEAVLTVAHGYSWVTAAVYAFRHNLPLYLIVHDDWPNLALIPKLYKPFLDRSFRKVYTQAKARFCISPSMVEAYIHRYGIKGTVLYPSRSANAPCFDSPSERLAEKKEILSIAFAGTINSAGDINMLKSLAICLKSCNGRLLLFGPLDKQNAIELGLNDSNIEVRGMIASNDLIKLLRDEVDALYVPLSFEAQGSTVALLSFPSKLADYTSIGLPLLVHGPDNCSAVRWVRENGDIAAYVTSPDPSDLMYAINRLQIPQTRIDLSLKAIEQGNKYFSHASAEHTFLSVLQM